MLRKNWKLWMAAGLSAGLLELPFPLAGPLPAWRTVFAWFGLVPMLLALLRVGAGGEPRPYNRSFLLAYVGGVLWYAGNCYWIYDTMRLHGNIPPVASVLILLAYSLVLGGYWGLFGLFAQLVRQRTGSVKMTLAIAPILWVGLELAAARITSVPWDQFGYSQVDNALVNQLAPWTGVYGISFVLVAVNALIAGGVVLSKAERRRVWGICGATLLVVGSAGMLVQPKMQETAATVALVQPNLNVDMMDSWDGAEWDRHITQFDGLARGCQSGLEEATKKQESSAPDMAQVVNACPMEEKKLDLVLWPESPAPFFEGEDRFQKTMSGEAQSLHAPMVIGGVGMDVSPEDHYWLSYNSAVVFGADGSKVGRYDKIHLVPFGEFVPYRNLFFFANKLTNRVGEITRGDRRKVFRLNGHSYGVFICYESVFADEVRQFAQLGAEVLVNISNDGWYGDTSAPWQHVNMVRMRAIENRRWILRDTNNGLTAVIDPNGRIVAKTARHEVNALIASYGFRRDITFYTAHGDVFAWGCAILGLGVVAWALRSGLRLKIQSKVGS